MLHVDNERQAPAGVGIAQVLMWTDDIDKHHGSLQSQVKALFRLATDR